MGSIQGPASPYQPDVEVQGSGGVSKTGNRFPLHRNPVLVDLLVKRLAESNYVVVCCGTCIRCSRVWIEPESHPIEEVKTAEVNESRSVWFFISSEEDGGRENPLKACYEAAIVRTILGQVKEIEHLGRGGKLNGSAPLLQREGGDPDGDQSVLTEGQAKIRMSSKLPLAGVTSQNVWY